MAVKYISQELAAQLDKELMGDEFGFNNDLLMELAGLSSAQAIAEAYSNTKFKNVLIIVGPGNNGGDGLVCGRHLYHFGYNVTLLYPNRKPILQFQNLLKQCKKLDIADTEVIPKTAKELNCYDLIVDAIFGYSFNPSREIASPYKDIIEVLNDDSLKPPIACLDIPSGWHNVGDEIKIKGIKNPDFLISLTSPKLAAKEFKGKYHYLGGRFVPPSMAQKYELNLPAYPGTTQYVRLN